MRILCVPMHFSFGHVIVLWGEFQPPKFPPLLNQTYSAEWTHVGLCPRFLVKYAVLVHDILEIQQTSCAKEQETGGIIEIVVTKCTL